MKNITIRAIHAISFTAVLVGIMLLIGSLDFPDSKPPFIQSALFISIGLVLYGYLGIKFKKELKPTKISQRMSSILGLLLIIFGALSAFGGFQSSNVVSISAGAFCFALGLFFKFKCKNQVATELS